MENNEHLRFKKLERIREIFTILFVGIGLFIIQNPLPNVLNPYPVTINKTGVYVVAAFLVLFTLIWHHFLPKKWAGQKKFFIETIVYTISISVLVWFTGGTYSYLAFFYYLPLLNAAANLNLTYTLFTAFLTTFLMAVQLTLLFGRSDFPNAISLFVLTDFGVWLVTTLGRFLANEVSLIHKHEEDLEVEQIREIDKLKDEFVFIIAHELRSPITAIRGYLELITTDPNNKVDEVLGSLLQRSFSTSNKLANLIGLLLEVARLETGKIRFYLQKIDVKESVEIVLNDLRKESERKQLKINLDVPEENLILFDKDRLQEILTVVIDNAIKFTPEYGRITILSQVTDKEILLSIADSGIGIPENIKDKLYDKFYSENSESGEIIVKGYGIGLYVTKQLLVKMSGDITCESVIGKGTTFTFHLPKYWNLGNS